MSCKLLQLNLLCLNNIHSLLQKKKLSSSYFGKKYQFYVILKFNLELKEQNRENI